MVICLEYTGNTTPSDELQCLFNQLIFKPGSILRHTMDIQLFSTYLPMDRRQALALGQPLEERENGVALLVDIAGFTPMAHALTSTLGPQRGVEELSGILNSIYEPLIDQVHYYGGSILGFSGDGFSCWFADDTGSQAVSCALGMQKEMAAVDAIPLSDSDVATIEMKIGIAAGPVRRLLVGDPNIQRLDIAVGTTLDRMAQAEKAAEPGEVIVGPEIASNLGELLRLAKWRGEFGVVADLVMGVPPAPWPDLPGNELDIEQIRPYLLPPVFERLKADQGEFMSELRPAVMLFLGFAGIDYEHHHAGHQLDTFICSVQRVLQRYGGYLLDLTIGDKGSSLYAPFGPLKAHEDNVPRVIAAAQELLRLPSELDLGIALRIGISQGWVRSGSQGSSARRAYCAVGHEVNVASRLMELASPGQILCSQRIFEATEGNWRFDSLGSVAVKGLSDPMPVYRPLGPRSTPVLHSKKTLVGRSHELKAITELLAETKSGKSQLLLLEGEAGIGKSRLLVELIKLAEMDDINCMVGTGQSIESRTAYYAWRGVLNSYFDLNEGMELSERQQRVTQRVASVNPVLAERASLLNDILLLDLPEPDMIQTFDASLRHESLTTLIIDLLLAATENGPMAIILEDAHWMDSVSWEMALSVIRAMPDEPLLLVLALRPIPESQSDALGYNTLVALRNSRVLQLEAMTPRETHALAAVQLGLKSDSISDEVTELLCEKAGGNPFFVEELVYALLDRGVLVADGGHYILADSQAWKESIPDTVEGIVLSRIDRLPLEEQVTLKVAAVIGRGFSYQTLRDVHPQQILEDLLQTQLSNMINQDLTLLESLEPELSYIFKHVITQQVAYDTLLFSQRRELHKRVAGWYEKYYRKNLAPYYSLLAYHWGQAEDIARERQYSWLAGIHAAAQFANTEAVVYFSHALALTSKDELMKRYELLLAREALYNIQGDRNNQAQDLAKLEELTGILAVETQAKGRQTALDPSQAAGIKAEVALRQADYYEAISDFEASIAAAKSAIELAGEAEDIIREARGALHWGRILSLQGEANAAQAQFQRSLALSKKAKSRQLEAESVRSLGRVAAFYNGQYDAAKDYLKHALDICQEIGDRKGEGSSVGYLGVVSWSQGDYAEASNYYQQALNIFRQIGDRMSESIALTNLGGVCAEQGDYVRAIACFEEDLRISREIGSVGGESTPLCNLGIVAHRLGDYTTAHSNYVQALDISQKVGNRRSESEALAYLGLLHHHLGDDSAAVEKSEQALEISREIATPDVEGYVLTHLGHALAALNRLSQASSVYTKALELRRELGQEHLAMESIAGLVRVSLLKGDLSQAKEWTEEILNYLGLDTTSTSLQHRLEGTNEPCLVYMSCYRSLQAAQDPRAAQVLSAANDLLEEYAAKVDDDALRHSFLENIRVHREITAEQEAL